MDKQPRHRPPSAVDSYDEVAENLRRIKREENRDGERPATDTPDSRGLYVKPRRLPGSV